MTTIIYHAEARRSERIAWLLEELDRPYELVFKPGDVVGSFDPLRATGHPFPMAQARQCLLEDHLLEMGRLLMHRERSLIGKNLIEHELLRIVGRLLNGQ